MAQHSCSIARAFKQMEEEENKFIAKNFAFTIIYVNTCC